LHGCILDEDFPYRNEGVEVPRGSIHSGFYPLENEVARLHGAARISFKDNNRDEIAPSLRRAGPQRRIDAVKE